MGEWALAEISQIAPGLIYIFRGLPAFLQDRSEVWTATVTLGSRNEGRGVDLGAFAGVLDILLLSVALKCVMIGASRRRGWPLRPQFRKSDLTLKAIRRHGVQLWAEAARGPPDNEGAFGATLPVGRFCPRSAPEQG